MTPDNVHPLERSQLTVESLFEDLATARRERLRGWAAQLDDETALTRGSFVLAQAAAAVEQVASTIEHPALDAMEMCELAQRLIRLAARFEQVSAESGVDSIS
jgi:hypothetical protein